MWLNTIRVRRLAQRLLGKDLSDQMYGVDEKPLHFNESGSKNMRTLELVGAPSVRLKQNHAATRGRVSVMTLVTSSLAAIHQPMGLPVLPFCQRSFHQWLHVWAFARAGPDRPQVIPGSTVETARSGAMASIGCFLRVWWLRAVVSVTGEAPNTWGQREALLVCRSSCFAGTKPTSESEVSYHRPSSTCRSSTPRRVLTGRLT